MSQFETNYGTGGYSSSTPEQRPPSRRGCWIGMVLLGCGGMLMLCCGGGVVAAYYAMGMVSDEVRAQLQDHPVIREHIGEIQKFNIDWLASAEAEGSDTFVWNIQGDKGSGKITATTVTDDQGDEQVVSAQLTLPSGESIPLEMP